MLCNILDNTHTITMWLSISVGNGSGWSASGLGMDSQNGLVQSQSRPNPRPADSCGAKPAPVPINLGVLPDLVRHVFSNLQFCISGFTLIVAFRYVTVNCKILKLARHGLFSMYWPSYCTTSILTFPTISSKSVSTIFGLASSVISVALNFKHP